MGNRVAAVGRPQRLFDKSELHRAGPGVSSLLRSVSFGPIERSLMLVGPSCDENLLSSPCRAAVCGSRLLLGGFGRVGRDRRVLEGSSFSLREL